MSALTLFQVSDEPSRSVGGADCARPDLLEVAQGGPRILQGVADPMVPGEEGRDVVAGLPGSVDVSPGFVVMNGLPVVA